MLELPISVVRDLLLYDTDTGVFEWRHDVGKRVKAGDRAGSLNSCGYIVIRIARRPYLAHRLAWAITHGEWPECLIDHVNGSRSDNRLRNLRQATYSENGQTRKLGKNSTSGVMGVTFVSCRSKWMAAICVRGRSKNLGYFCSRDDAAAAYLEAKRNIHPFSNGLTQSAVKECVEAVHGSY